MHGIIDVRGERTMSRKRIPALVLGLLVVAVWGLRTLPAIAHFVPSPCDFITGGGFVFKDNLERANFGAHGGCKENGPDAPFWGHVNYVDHDPTPQAGGTKSPYHVNSTQITGYLCDPAFPNARDVCGFARTSTGETVRFRVRLVDNGEGTNAACKDEFGIVLDNGYEVRTRPLAADRSGGGNIQLHKDNPSTGGAFGDDGLCGGLGNPGDPVQPQGGDAGCPINPEAAENCH
jgi:hypothetical protein